MARGGGAWRIAWSPTATSGSTRAAAPGIPPRWRGHGRLRTMLGSTRDQGMPMNTAAHPLAGDAAAPARRGVAVGIAARVALWLALASGVAALLAGPGYRLGWWNYGSGIQVLRWAATLAIGVALFALFTALVGWKTGARGPTRNALLGLLVALLVAVPPLLQYRQATQLPRIHHISTHTTNPPRFVDVLPLRGSASNPVEWSASVAEQQRRAYPDIAPLQLGVPPAQALQTAERVARSLGWEIVAVAPAEQRLEATATSLLFGFKDDVVVRVTADGSGSRVDVRSTSRVGVSDIGVNAKRVRAFAEALQAAARG
jgi:uncharacterized protein (DUF1499 family)